MNRINFQENFKKGVVFSENIHVFCNPFFKQELNNRKMSRICEITGKKLMSGNHVSHSNSKTKRKFYPNLHTKKFFIPEENRYITLKVSAKGMRIISKKGIAIAIKDAKAAGFYTN